MELLKYLQVIFGMNSDIHIQAQNQAALCKVFSNARRILIVWSIAEKELSVGEIATRVGSSLQNVSQHIGILKKYRIIESRRDGQTIYYRIGEHEWLKKCPVIFRTPRGDFLGE